MPVNEQFRHLFERQPSRDFSLACGAAVEVIRLKLPADRALLTAWACAFRQNYCLDNEIDDLRRGTGLSRKQYLDALCFPDRTAAPGPSIRSGDFAELLVTDYVEHVLGYHVPRGKYGEKASRNESVKGVDIIGIKFADSTPTPADELIAFEVKAQLTGTTYGGRLQTAIEDSNEDYLRKAYTLNALKRRLLARGQTASAEQIARFQNPADKPYRFRSGAAAVLNQEVFEVADFSSSTTAAHNNRNSLTLIVVHGEDMMSLAHTIFDVAGDEA
jgi:hypothetical protein